LIAETIEGRGLYWRRNTPSMLKSTVNVQLKLYIGGYRQKSHDRQSGTQPKITENYEK
jgi:hypothetical protein